MTRKSNLLNDSKIKSIKPIEKEQNLLDGEGLYFRVTTTGSRSWVFRYVHPFTKKKAQIGFGSYPEISLAEARKKRTSARELIAHDKDPKEHRDSLLDEQRAIRQNTFEVVAANWFEIKRTSLKESTANDIWRSLELHVFPDIGKTPISLLTPLATIRTLKAVESRGNIDMVSRLCQRINEIMVYALNSGLVEQNLLQGIKKAFKTAPKAHYATIKPDELPELMKALQRANIKITTRALIEWQLHTIVRPSEAVGTRWDEIDFENALWNIPAERMKRNRAHTVPLSKQAISLLEFMRPISGHREFVFPSDRNPSTHMNSESANAAIKNMGFKGRLVSHGLRSLASTTLNEQEFDSELIEVSLAHIDKNTVRKAYNRAEYIEQRRIMMNWWSAHIEQASVVKTGLGAK